MLPHYVRYGNIPLNELCDRIQELKGNAFDPIEYTNWADLDFAVQHYLSSEPTPDLTVVKIKCLQYGFEIVGNVTPAEYSIKVDAGCPCVYVNYVSFSGESSTICSKCGKLK